MMRGEAISAAMDCSVGLSAPSMRQYSSRLSSAITSAAAPVSAHSPSSQLHF